MRPILSHARFYGATTRRREAAGFTLALMNADPLRDVVRHTHETAHWILVVRGPYLSAARGAPHLITAPTLIYNPPGTTHRDRFLAIDGRFQGRFLSIAMTPDRLSAVAESGATADHAIAFASPNDTTAGARLVRELEGWDSSSTLVIEGACLELACRISRTDDAGGRDAPAWIRTACEQLRDRCSEAVTIAELARASAVHPVHFARAFRRYLGASPGEYLRRCRVERGGALLRDTLLPVGDVALACGYTDQSHFTRFFRRAYGLPPAQYRRALQGAI